MHSVFNSEASFEYCTFNGLTTFHLTSFNGEVDFNAALFIAHASFRDAIFQDYVRFTGVESRPMFCSTSSLDLQFAKIEEPSHVLLHTLILRPILFSRRYIPFHFCRGNRISQEARDTLSSCSTLKDLSRFGN